MHAGKQPCVFREKSRIKTSHCIHRDPCSHHLFLKGASFFLLSCVTCLWTQDVGAMDMGLLEREMDCIARYMRPICHLMSRLFHTMSPTVQGCHTNWFVCDRQGTSYAPDVPSKEAFTARKEAYSAEVSDEWICVTPLLVITCFAVCCSMLQCVAVCCSVLQCVLIHVRRLLRMMWVAACCSVLQCVLQCVAVCVAVCCSVLQCVAQCVLIHERRLPGITCVAVCCGVLQCVGACVAVCCSVLQCVDSCIRATRSSMCHDSSIHSTWLTWLLQNCDPTRSYVCHDSPVCDTWVPWRLHTCAPMCSCVYHDSVSLYAMTHWRVCLDVRDRTAFMCAVPHSYVTELIHMWHNSLTRLER